MIVSFKGRAVEAVAQGKAPKGFPPDLVARGERHLRAIANATQLNDLRSPPGNHLEALKGSRTDSIQFASTTSGASVSNGPLLARKTLRLSITIEWAICPTLGGS